MNRPSRASLTERISNPIVTDLTRKKSLSIQQQESVARLSKPRSSQDDNVIFADNFYRTSRETKSNAVAEALIEELQRNAVRAKASDPAVKRIYSKKTSDGAESEIKHVIQDRNRKDSTPPVPKPRDSSKYNERATLPPNHQKKARENEVARRVTEPENAFSRRQRPDLEKDNTGLHTTRNRVQTEKTPISRKTPDTGNGRTATLPQYRHSGQERAEPEQRKRGKQSGSLQLTPSVPNITQRKSRTQAMEVSPKPKDLTQPQSLTQFYDEAQQILAALPSEDDVSVGSDNSQKTYVAKRSTPTASSHKPSAGLRPGFQRQYSEPENFQKQQYPVYNEAGNDHRGTKRPSSLQREPKVRQHSGLPDNVYIKPECYRVPEEEQTERAKYFGIIFNCLNESRAANFAQNPIVKHYLRKRTYLDHDCTVKVPLREFLEWKQELHNLENELYKSIHKQKNLDFMFADVMGTINELTDVDDDFLDELNESGEQYADIHEEVLVRLLQKHEWLLTLRDDFQDYLRIMHKRNVQMAEDIRAREQHRQRQGDFDTAEVKRAQTDGKRFERLMAYQTEKARNVDQEKRQRRQEMVERAAVRHDQYVRQQRRSSTAGRQSLPNKRDTVDRPFRHDSREFPPQVAAVLSELLPAPRLSEASSLPTLRSPVRSDQMVLPWTPSPTEKASKNSAESSIPPRPPARLSTHHPEEDVLPGSSTIEWGDEYEIEDDHLREAPSVLNVPSYVSEYTDQDASEQGSSIPPCMYLKSVDGLTDVPRCVSQFDDYPVERGVSANENATRAVLVQDTGTSTHDLHENTPVILNTTVSALPRAPSRRISSRHLAPPQRSSIATQQSAVNLTHGGTQPSSASGASLVHAGVQPSTTGAVKLAHVGIQPSTASSVSLVHTAVQPSAASAVKLTHAGIQPSLISTPSLVHAGIQHMADSTAQLTHVGIQPSSTSSPSLIHVGVQPSTTSRAPIHAGVQHSAVSMPALTHAGIQPSAASNTRVAHAGVQSSSIYVPNLTHAVQPRTLGATRTTHVGVQPSENDMPEYTQMGSRPGAINGTHAATQHSTLEIPRDPSQRSTKSPSPSGSRQHVAVQPSGVNASHAGTQHSPLEVPRVPSRRSTKSPSPSGSRQHVAVQPSGVNASHAGTQHSPLEVPRVPSRRSTKSPSPSGSRQHVAVQPSGVNASHAGTQHSTLEVPRVPSRRSTKSPSPSGSRQHVAVQPSGANTSHAGTQHSALDIFRVPSQTSTKTPSPAVSRQHVGVQPSGGNAFHAGTQHSALETPRAPSQRSMKTPSPTVSRQHVGIQQSVTGTSHAGTHRSEADIVHMDTQTHASHGHLAYPPTNNVYLALQPSDSFTGMSRNTSPPYFPSRHADSGTQHSSTDLVRPRPQSSMGTQPSWQSLAPEDISRSDTAGRMYAAAQPTDTFHVAVQDSRRDLSHTGTQPSEVDIAHAGSQRSGFPVGKGVMQTSQMLSPHAYASQTMHRSPSTEHSTNMTRMAPSRSKELMPSPSSRNDMAPFRPAPLSMFLPHDDLSNNKLSTRADLATSRNGLGITKSVSEGHMPSVQQTIGGKKYILIPAKSRTADVGTFLSAQLSAQDLAYSPHDASTQTEVTLSDSKVIVSQRELDMLRGTALPVYRIPSARSIGVSPNRSPLISPQPSNERLLPEQSISLPKSKSFEQNLSAESLQEPPESILTERFSPSIRTAGSGRDFTPAEKLSPKPSQELQQQASQDSMGLHITGGCRVLGFGEPLQQNIPVCPSLTPTLDTSAESVTDNRPGPEALTSNISLMKLRAEPLSMFMANEDHVGEGIDTRAERAMDKSVSEMAFQEEITPALIQDSAEIVESLSRTAEAEVNEMPGIPQTPVVPAISAENIRSALKPKASSNVSLVRMRPDPLSLFEPHDEHEGVTTRAENAINKSRSAVSVGDDYLKTSRSATPNHRQTDTAASLTAVRTGISDTMLSAVDMVEKISDAAAAETEDQDNLEDLPELHETAADVINALFQDSENIADVTEMELQNGNESLGGLPIAYENTLAVASMYSLPDFAKYHDSAQEISAQQDTKARSMSPLLPETQTGNTQNEYLNAQGTSGEDETSKSKTDFKPPDFPISVEKASDMDVPPANSRTHLVPSKSAVLLSDSTAMLGEEIINDVLSGVPVRHEDLNTPPGALGPTRSASYLRPETPKSTISTKRLSPSNVQPAESRTLLAPSRSAISSSDSTAMLGEEIISHILSGVPSRHGDLNSQPGATQSVSHLRPETPKSAVSIERLTPADIQHAKSRALLAPSKSPVSSSDSTALLGEEIISDVLSGVPSAHKFLNVPPDILTAAQPTSELSLQTPKSATSVQRLSPLNIQPSKSKALLAPSKSAFPSSDSTGVLGEEIISDVLSAVPSHHDDLNVQPGTVDLIRSASQLRVGMPENSPSTAESSIRLGNVIVDDVVEKTSDAAEEHLLRKQRSQISVTGISPAASVVSLAPGRPVSPRETRSDEVLNKTAYDKGELLSAVPSVATVSPSGSTHSMWRPPSQMSVESLQSSPEIASSDSKEHIPPGESLNDFGSVRKAKSALSVITPSSRSASTDNMHDYANTGILALPHPTAQSASNLSLWEPPSQLSVASDRSGISERSLSDEYLGGNVPAQPAFLPESEPSQGPTSEHVSDNTHWSIEIPSEERGIASSEHLAKPQAIQPDASHYSLFEIPSQLSIAESSNSTSQLSIAEEHEPSAMSAEKAEGSGNKKDLNAQQGSLPNTALQAPQTVQQSKSNYSFLEIPSEMSMEDVHSTTTIASSRSARLDQPERSIHDHLSSGYSPADQDLTKDTAKSTDAQLPSSHSRLDVFEISSQLSMESSRASQNVLPDRSISERTSTVPSRPELYADEMSSASQQDVKPTVDLGASKASSRSTTLGQTTVQDTVAAESVYSVFDIPSQVSMREINNQESAAALTPDQSEQHDQSVLNNSIPYPPTSDIAAKVAHHSSGIKIEPTADQDPHRAVLANMLPDSHSELEMHHIPSQLSIESSTVSERGSSGAESGSQEFRRMDPEPRGTPGSDNLAEKMHVPHDNNTSSSPGQQLSASSFNLARIESRAAKIAGSPSETDTRAESYDAEEIGNETHTSPSESTATSSESSHFDHDEKQHLDRYIASHDSKKLRKDSGSMREHILSPRLVKDTSSIDVGRSLRTKDTHEDFPHSGTGGKSSTHMHLHSGRSEDDLYRKENLRALQDSYRDKEYVHSPSEDAKSVEMKPSPSMEMVSSESPYPSTDVSRASSPSWKSEDAAAPSTPAPDPMPARTSSESEYTSSPEDSNKTNASQHGSSSTASLVPPETPLENPTHPPTDANRTESARLIAGMDKENRPDKLPSTSASYISSTSSVDFSQMEKHAALVASATSGAPGNTASTHESNVALRTDEEHPQHQTDIRIEVIPAESGSERVNVEIRRQDRNLLSATKKPSHHSSKAGSRSTSGGSSASSESGTPTTASRYATSHAPSAVRGSESDVSQVSMSSSPPESTGSSGSNPASTDLEKGKTASDHKEVVEESSSRQYGGPSDKPLPTLSTNESVYVSIQDMHTSPLSLHIVSKQEDDRGTSRTEQVNIVSAVQPDRVNVTVEERHETSSSDPSERSQSDTESNVSTQGSDEKKHSSE